MGLTKRKARRGGTIYATSFVQFNVRNEDGKLYLNRRGKRKRWLAGRDKREARAQEAIIRTKLLQGWQVEPEQERITTLREFVERWKVGAKRNLAARTYAGYEQVLDLYILPELGGRDIKSLTWADAKSLIAEKQSEGYTHVKKGQDKASRKSYSANTLRLIRATLSTVLSEAAEEGLISTNPLIGQRQRRRGSKSVLSEVSVLSWEQKQIFESKLAELESMALLSPSYATLLFLMVHAGLRPGEARALKPGDIDFQGKRLRVERSATLGGALKSTKTGEARSLSE